MNKSLPLLLLVLSLAWGILSITGCAQPTDDPESTPSLEGYWKSSYGDGFEISGTSYKQYDDSTKSVSFAGTIVNNPDRNAASDSLTIRITDSGSWGKTVDRYYVIKWKTLAGKGISQSAANNGIFTDVKNNGMETQALAEAEYTEGNGYFGYYGDYVKQ